MDGGFSKSTATISGGAERAADRRGKAQTEVETPFLLPMLFALQSDELRLLPLAAALARSSRGLWNDERNEFHVHATAAQGLPTGTKWSIRTVHMLSLD